MKSTDKKLLGIIAEQLARIIELEECLKQSDVMFEKLSKEKTVKRAKRWVRQCIYVMFVIGSLCVRTF